MSCRNFIDCVNACASAYGLANDDLVCALDGHRNVIGTILMGACVFSAYIFSKKGKKLTFGAVKNMGARFLELASTFDKGLARKIQASHRS